MAKAGDEANPTPTGSLRTTAESLRSLAGDADRTLGRLVTMGAISGLLEAIVLILFIRAALAAARNDGRNVELFGVALDVGPGMLLTVTALITMIVALLHVAMAQSSASLSEAVVTSARDRLIDGYLHSKWSEQVVAAEGTLQESATALAFRAARAASALVSGAATVVVFMVMAAMAVLVAPVVSSALYLALVPVVLILRPLVRTSRRSAAVDTETGATFRAGDRCDQRALT